MSSENKNSQDPESCDTLTRIGTGGVCPQPQSGANGSSDGAEGNDNLTLTELVNKFKKKVQYDKNETQNTTETTGSSKSYDPLKSILRWHRAVIFMNCAGVDYNTEGVQDGSQKVKLTYETMEDAYPLLDNIFKDGD